MIQVGSSGSFGCGRAQNRPLPVAPLHPPPRDDYMNGAAETARLAARVMLNRIEKQSAVNTLVEKAAARALNSR